MKYLNQRIIVFIFLTILIFMTFQNCSRPNKSTGHVNDVEKLSLRIASIENSKETREELIDLAKKRKEELKKIMISDPSQLFRLAIPEDKRSHLPQDVQEQLLKKIEITGKLEAVYEDYPDGSHKLRHFVKTKFNEKLELIFADKSTTLNSDINVSINGLQLDNMVALESGDTSIVTMDCCESQTVSTASTPEIAGSYGQKRVLVILLNFEDKQEQPWNHDEVQQVIFNESNDYFKEASYGQASITGEIAGWYTIPLSSTICDDGAILRLGKEAAQADGYVLGGNYDRYIYAFPKNACGWGGRANIGGWPTDSWLNGYMRAQLVTHELGHNFGLGHSKSLVCDAGAIEGSCYTKGYGDTLDTMGNYNIGHYNTFQKERLGWLGFNNLPEITTVESSGTYTIKPYETNEIGSKALKVLKSIDPTTNRKTWYYVEFRQALGFDSFINPTNSYVDSQNILNGVVIHTATESDYASSMLLDMTQGSVPTLDSSDPALVVGKTFYDAQSGVSITTQSVNSSQAEVIVQVGSTTNLCVTAQPTLSVTPNESQWVESGTPVNYTLTLKNNDNSSCNATTFNLTALNISDWNMIFSKSSLSIEPGNSSTSTLTVSSPSTQIDGFYNIQINAESNVHGTISENVTYVISNPEVNNAPVAGNDNAITEENTSVIINVLGNDSDPDGDTLTVISTSGVNGNTVINGNGTITFTPATDFVGTETFNYTVSDGRGKTDTAIVTVIVEAAIDTTPPIVTITSPSDGETIASKSTLSIAAAASDNVKVAKVDFYIDGNLICSDTSATYSCNFSVPGGKSKSFIIEAKATDTSGNVASHRIQVSSGNSTSGGNTDGGAGKGNGKGPSK